jgi:rubrerythrin
LKRVYSSFSLTAAHHARNVLEAQGIRSVVRNEILSSAMGELPPAECQAEVWVLRACDADRAARLLKEGPVDATATPWTCPSCGETAEPQFAQCWRCGTDRPA